MTQATDQSPPTQWPLKVLAGWLALGLVVQTSFVLLPIGNYSTLVYWLFYIPILILAGWQRQKFKEMLRSSDRFLVLVLASLFLWVAITSLWSGAEESPVTSLLQFTRHALLILFYIAGIAFLTRYCQRALVAGLAVSALIVALAAVASVMDLYVIDGKPIFRRLSVIGFAEWAERTNAVVAGIYFGIFALMPLALLTGKSTSTTLAALLLASAALASFTAMFLTGTRTALLALLAVGLLYLLIQRRFWALAAAIAACTAVLIYGMLDESTHLHDYLTRGGIGSLRPEIWLAALHSSVDKLAVGSGIWHPFELIATTDNGTSNQPHSHNFYLQLLNWTGIVGLGLYVCLLGRSLVLGCSQRQQPLGAVAFLGLIYFAIVQLFDVYDVFTKPSYYWPCLWLPIGIVLGLASRPTATIEASSQDPEGTNAAHPQAV